METYTDLITGKTIPYNDDEYIRQKVEAILLEKGYAKDQVQVDACRELTLEQRSINFRADILIYCADRPGMILRCARGSLVTRERETIATACLLTDPAPPFALVCNGEDAELLEVITGKVLKEGLDAIPTARELARMVKDTEPYQPSEQKRINAARIYAAYAFLQCPPLCRV
jgi:hypothetical protein